MDISCVSPTLFRLIRPQLPRQLINEKFFIYTSESETSSPKFRPDKYESRLQCDCIIQTLQVNQILLKGRSNATMSLVYQTNDLYNLIKLREADPGGLGACPQRRQHLLQKADTGGLGVLSRVRVLGLFCLGVRVPEQSLFVSSDARLGSGSWE